MHSLAENNAKAAEDRKSLHALAYVSSQVTIFLFQLVKYILFVKLISFCVCGWDRGEEEIELQGLGI